VPLLRGGDDPDKLLAAVRMLDALPRPESADAMASLLDLAGQRYDRATFWNVLGKDRVMQSWLWQLGRDEGEARAGPKARREPSGSCAPTSRRSCTLASRHVFSRHRCVRPARDASILDPAVPQAHRCRVRRARDGHACRGHGALAYEPALQDVASTRSGEKASLGQPPR
jgi:hypothetical protein